MRRMHDINDIKADILDPYTLQDAIEGSDDIVVDVNEAGDKLQVSLDNDVKSLLRPYKHNIKMTFETTGGSTVEATGVMWMSTNNTITDADSLDIALKSGCSLYCTGIDFSDNSNYIFVGIQNTGGGERDKYFTFIHVDEIVNLDGTEVTVTDVVG